MPLKRFPKQTLLAKVNGKTLVKTRWINYIEDLEWNRLVLHLSEMMEVMENCEVWRLNLKLLSLQSSRKSEQ